MTHEELLEKVNIRAAWEEKRSDGTTILAIDYDDAPNTKALRAVVELHKPIEKEERIVDGVNPAKVQVRICCQVCYNPRRYSYIEPYPCQTIQAIEKELG